MSRRVLVVEDDVSTADYIAKGLREEGFTVEQAGDGRDALYLATSSEFDAIVMDRMIPGLDGLSVVKALRAAGASTPILILSAMGHLDERVKGLRAGG
ncbi:MAG TPA: response regulator, partial [Phenylobacterium sp.]|uniref:response regulator n=1 Tax=Phenylobacterium sp. TaxID=1871053 RepID=UPI002B773D3F